MRIDLRNPKGEFFNVVFADTRTKSVQPWLIDQLAHLARLDPEAVSTALACVWQGNPEFHKRLVLGALDRRAITLVEASEALDLSAEATSARLEAFRQDPICRACCVHVEDPVRGACLVGTGITVWEVVREHRRLGGLAELESKYPSLSKMQIEAAIQYAELHPVEIDTAIEAYESRLGARLEGFRMVR